MARWCDKYDDDKVAFLCVSVEGLNCARFFAQFVGRCINATMLPNEFPSFPIQLGCSGFVVLDKFGNIVTTRTAPKFLDLPEESFLSVERALDGLGYGLRTEDEDIPRSETKSTESQEIILKPLPPVGHCEMDQEHASIDECLAKLLIEPSKNVLLNLRNILQEHFSHEEALLFENKFGGTGALSAFESHKGDHQRILSGVDAVLASATDNISQADIRKMADKIYQHGDRFDSLYAKRVSCASCEKA